MEKFLDDFAKIPQKQKLAGLLAIIVALGVAHFFLVFQDQSAKLVQRTQQFDKLNTDLVEKQAIAENLTKYREEVKRLEGELEKAKAFLPDTAELPAFMSQISSIATQAGLEVSRFEPLREDTRDFYARLPYKMRLTGSYHEVATFIDNIGRLERIVNVENLGMDKPNNKNKKFVLQTEFLVTTYRFVDTGGGKK